MKTVELELWKNTKKEWVLSMDGVVIGMYHMELAARHDAAKVKEFNPGIAFREIG